MHVLLQLISSSALLWIYLQATWNILASVFYHFCVPWIVWGSLIIAIGFKVARIPPPNSSIVQEVLGVNPLLTKEDNPTSNDQGNGEQNCLRVVAHRGAGYDYPENSLTAFHKCKENGCNGIELDLLLTKDNIPIIFHDSTIERLTGQPGFVKNMTWDQLKDLDITYNHSLKHKFENGDKIALFHDALEMCLKNEQRIFIDIKESKKIIVQIILDAYKKYPKLFQRGMVCCFDPTVLYMIRRKEPKIVSGLIWRPQFYSRVSYNGLRPPANRRTNNTFKYLIACLAENIYERALSNFVYYVVGASALLLHKDLLNQRIIEKWRDRNIRILAWPVNLPSEKVFISRTLKVTYLTDTLLGDKEL